MRTRIGKIHQEEEKQKKKLFENIILELHSRKSIAPFA
jgi:hypothetical protein